MAFIEKEGSIKSKDDLELFFRSWIPQNGQVSHHVIIVHGFGEHSGRYNHLVQQFQDAAIAFHAMDHRGHGRSQGIQGDGKGILQYCEDLDLFFQYLEKEYQMQRPLLLGHSMGALISLAFTLLVPGNQTRIRALAISGAIIGVVLTPVMRIKKMFGHIIHLFHPGFRMPVGLKLHDLSHDPKTIEEYRTDPLVHGVMSIRMALDVGRTGDRVMAKKGELTIPFFLGHGTEDHIGDPSRSAIFADGVSSADKTIHFYDGMYHEIYNELEPMQKIVYGDIIPWVKGIFEKYP